MYNSFNYYLAREKAFGLVDFGLALLKLMNGSNA